MERRGWTASRHRAGAVARGMVRGMETSWTLQIRQRAVDPRTLLNRENATDSHLVDGGYGSRKPLWRKSPWVQIPPPPPIPARAI